MDAAAGDGSIDSNDGDVFNSDASEINDIGSREAGSGFDATARDAFSGADATARDAIAGADAAAPDAAAPPPLPICKEACSTPADCVLASPIYDATHWRCTSGACDWTGCRNSSECEATFMRSGYVCHQDPGWPVASCLEACSSVSDCTTPSSPLYDNDNYSCNGGVCRWTGCNNSTECRTAFADQRYVCATFGGTTFRSCFLGCTVSSDCQVQSLPAYDADNYTCVSGHCEYAGCHNDAECRASFTTGDYVCR